MTTDAMLDKLEVAIRDNRRVVKVSVKELTDRKEALAAVEEAMTAVQAVVAELQAATHDRVAALVTECLRTVFPDAGLSFRIDFKSVKGRGFASPVFSAGGHDFDPDPDSEAAGGWIDVAAFALRLAVLMASSPRPAKILFMDEPFRFVSAGHRPAVKDLLEGLSVKLGIQIVMVTHIEELVAGTTVNLEDSSCPSASPPSAAATSKRSSRPSGRT